MVRRIGLRAMFAFQANSFLVLYHRRGNAVCYGASTLQIYRVDQKLFAENKQGYD